MRWVTSGTPRGMARDKNGLEVTALMVIGLVVVLVIFLLVTWYAR